MKVSRFALAVRHRVPDPASAEHFLVDTLGFEVRQRSDRSVRLENGALGLILERADESGSDLLTLEVVSEDPRSVAEDLASWDGVAVVAEAAWISDRRCECVVSSPHRLRLIVYRELNEDELPTPPPLVTSILWPEAVIELVQLALRRVPLAFRPASRERVVAATEAGALAEGRIEATAEDAAAALLQETPEFRREAVLQWLAERGLALNEEPGP